MNNIELKKIYNTELKKIIAKYKTEYREAKECISLDFNYFTIDPEESLQDQLIDIVRFDLTYKLQKYIFLSNYKGKIKSFKQFTQLYNKSLECISYIDNKIVVNTNQIQTHTYYIDNKKCICNFNYICKIIKFLNLTYNLNIPYNITFYQHRELYTKHTINNQYSYLVTLSELLIFKS